MKNLVKELEELNANWRRENLNKNGALHNVRYSFCECSNKIRNGKELPGQACWNCGCQIK